MRINRQFKKPAITIGCDHFHVYDENVYLRDGVLSIQYSFYDGKWRSDEMYFDINSDKDIKFVKKLYDKALTSKLIDVIDIKFPSCVRLFIGYKFANKWLT